MPFVNTQVHFEQYDPRDEKGTDVRRSLADLDYSPLPRVTMRSFVMGCLISMGGLVFGYDTGQISGFLEMPNFLMRFGQQHADGTYYFSNVRSGLIVALVRVPISNAYNRILTTSSYQLVHLSALLLLRSSGRQDRSQDLGLCLGRCCIHWFHHSDLCGHCLVSSYDRPLHSRSRRGSALITRAYVSRFVGSPRQAPSCVLTLPQLRPHLLGSEEL